MRIASGDGKPLGDVLLALTEDEARELQDALREHGLVVTARARVVLYSAPGCHLCTKALSVLETELGDAFEEVDITDDAELEQRYREWLPVVEVDGERAFVYFVDAPALRRKLSRN